MIPYQDAYFLVPFNTTNNFEVQIHQRLYIEVQVDGVDDQQFAVILDSCWATPENDASFPVRWDLLIDE